MYRDCAGRMLIYDVQSHKCCLLRCYVHYIHHYVCRMMKCGMWMDALMHVDSVVIMYVTCAMITCVKCVAACIIIMGVTFTV